MLATWGNYHRLVGGGDNSNSLEWKKEYEKKLNDDMAQLHHRYNKVRNNEGDNEEAKKIKEDANVLTIDRNRLIEEIKEEEPNYDTNPPNENEVQFFIECHGSPLNSYFDLPSNTEITFHIEENTKSRFFNKFIPVKGRTNLGSSYEYDIDKSKKVPNYNLQFGNRCSITIKKKGQKPIIEKPRISQNNTLETLVNNFRKIHPTKKISVYCDFCR